MKQETCQPSAATFGAGQNTSSCKHLLLPLASMDALDGGRLEVGKGLFTFELA